MERIFDLILSNQGDEEWWWDVYTKEILPRLPADHLQTLKTVCKLWLRIIPSPCFVGLHLSTYNQTLIRILIMPQQNPGTLTEYNNINRDEEPKQIHLPPAIGGTTHTILGSGHGLLCLLRRGTTGAVAVYNPSTGKYSRQQLPTHRSHGINCFWFGQHPSSGEYVLVLVLGVVLTNFQGEVGVYRFTPTSNLELIQSTSCVIGEVLGPSFLGGSEERCILLHGALHWSAEWINLYHNADSRLVICAYHLDSNNYFEISPPVQRKCELGVTADGCLFATSKPDAIGAFEMWIMNEYGVEESWMKYARIMGFDDNIVLSPLGFAPNGDLILDVDKSRLMRYSFYHSKAELLMNHGRGEAIMCADSLVSPTIVVGGVVQ